MNKFLFIGLTITAFNVNAYSEPCPINDLSDISYLNTLCQFNLGSTAYRAKAYSQAAAHWQLVISSADDTAEDIVLKNTALSTLSYLKYNGLGVKPDKESVVLSWVEAAKAGEYEARSHLGFAFSDRNFLGFDLVKALAWYKTIFLVTPNPQSLDESEQRIYNSAVLAVENIEKELSINKIAQANKLAYKLRTIK